MIKNFCRALICIVAFGCNAAMSQQPTTQPAQPTEPDAIINLWPTVPTTQPAKPEVVTERGKNGRHDRLIKDVTNPRLRAFLPKNPDPNRPACIICPGGGYTYLTVDYEGDEVARMLNQHGVAAFVLLYRLPNGSAPVEGVLPPPIADVQRAIRILRNDADKYNINPNQLGILGFSAGGHVASTAATQFDAGDAKSDDPIARQSCRPDFAVLAYPVISMHDPIAHVGSRHNLLGKTTTSEWEDRYSADQNITANTPPLFVVHAEDDKTVPVENSIRVADAAAKAHVPCQLVLLKTGGHGFGLGIHGGEPTSWPGVFLEWLHARKILAPQ